MAVDVTTHSSTLVGARALASRVVHPLAVASTFSVILLILAAGLARVTGASQACPVWPTCNGQLAAPGDLASTLEWTHRTLSATSGVLAVALAWAAWRSRRARPWLAGALLSVPLGLGIQVALGGAVVLLDQPTVVVTVHLGLGFAILGVLAWAAACTRPAASGPTARPASGRRPLALLTGLYVLAAGSLFGLVVLGGYTRATGAGYACVGFPACEGLGVMPFGRGSALLDLHLAHRAAGMLVLVVVGGLVMAARRVLPAAHELRLALGVLSAAIVLQAIVGVVAVSTGVPPVTQVLHLIGAVAAWVAVAAAGGFLSREWAAAAAIWPGQSILTAPRAPAEWAVARPSTRTLILAYVELTKPRVMSLLLVTTVAAMVIAEQGMPHPRLLLWTILGGALATGGAGAINHYLDRDIDPLMGRTARRPIPAGIIRPSHALWFGIVLAVMAFGVYGAFVNVLAGVLAMVGLLTYVLVYTLWLKRTTPSNIVIGGAAGALPPMVGWAAVTNDISLTAWYLFAIVFFWTPPHFWALSLLIRQHYERANIPMLPVVRGDRETRWQILLYSLLLVALSLLLSPFRLMGLLYFGLAVALGGILVVLAVRLWREATLQAARRLYLYSMLYLAALFASMAVDRVLVRALAR